MTSLTRTTRQRASQHCDEARYWSAIGAIRQQALRRTALGNLHQCAGHAEDDRAKGGARDPSGRCDA